MNPLMQFKSHVEGKNADVMVYVDRIEWLREGRMGTGAKLALGAATLGTSLLKTGVGGKQQGSEVIPIKSVSSVTTKKDGIRFTKVTVITTGNTIDFRVPHAEAEPIKRMITQLVLGDHPAQQEAAAPEPTAATAATPVPPPPVPSIPAGWNPDPHGRFELRYWDGARWTEHVSSAGEQSTDQPG